MTSAYIIQRGTRWIVVVTHPETHRWELSCSSRERAEHAAHLIRQGLYTGC